ncbi:MAG: MerR family transcriptional regulator [Actinomycetia bacterium]|nr:MerR family transcriptional regulator [Actinomycetes bacterium]
MDDSDPLYSIGDLARRTGLTVKTVRFYSDRGIVTPAGRTAAGYRRYDADAAARLDLVRTLRDLGVDLATIRRVVEREVSLAQVAAEHAAAIDVQIRVLRMRQAVLATAAERGSGTEELTLVHQLARLSEDERSRLVKAFLDEVFHDFTADPRFAGAMRSLSAHLPDDAAPERLQAWVDLAELSEDPGFRAYMRQLVTDEATERERSGGTAGLRRDLAATVDALVAPAVAAGVEPGSPQAVPFVAALDAGCAAFLGPGATSARRTRLTSRASQLNDPRRERYTRLLAVVNGWPQPQSLAPVLDWTVRALAAAPAA